MIFMISKDSKTAPAALLEQKAQWKAKADGNKPTKAFFASPAVQPTPLQFFRNYWGNYFSVLEATQLKATWYTNVLLLVDPSDSINAACMSLINSFSQSVGASLNIK